MDKTRCGVTLAVAAMALLWAGTALAATDAEKCAAYKLKDAGKYASCRMKAESKAVKMGIAADYSKCDEKIGGKFNNAAEGFGRSPRLDIGFKGRPRWNLRPADVESVKRSRSHIPSCGKRTTEAESNFGKPAGHGDFAPAKTPP